jgi:hypothetical protein
VTFAPPVKKFPRFIVGTGTLRKPVVAPTLLAAACAPV